MADANTQQPQGPGLGSEILSGLGQVLPYAVPTALGAIMGRGLPGGALGGAAMGAGFAGSDIQAEKEKQQELAMQQQRLRIEAQEGDIEIQKGKLALQNDADKKDYAKSIKDPEQRRMYLDEPDTYFANMQWKNFSGVLSQDPTFKTSNPELAKMLPNLPPAMGQKLLESALSGKYQHVLPPTQQKDGSWAAEAIKGDGTIDLIPTGKPASTANIELRDAGKGGVSKKLPTPTQALNQAIKLKTQVAMGTWNPYGINIMGASVEDQKAAVKAGLVDDYGDAGMTDEQADKYVQQAFGETKKTNPNDAMKRAPTKKVGDIPPPPAGFKVAG